MNQSRLFVKYARALQEYSVDQNAAELVYLDMLSVYKIINSSTELQELFSSPVIFPSKKAALIERVFTGKLNPVSLRFLIFLVRKRREAYLKNILISYFIIYRKFVGIIKVDFSSAVAIELEERNQIQQNIKNLLTGSVEMNFFTKPELIGGFTLAMNDQMLDASIAAKLKYLKNRILEANQNS